MADPEFTLLDATATVEILAENEPGVTDSEGAVAVTEAASMVAPILTEVPANTPVMVPE